MRRHTSEQGEDRDANSALHEDTDVGQLENSWRDAVCGRRNEELAVKGTREMRGDDHEGGQATEALWRFNSWTWDATGMSARRDRLTSTHFTFLSPLGAMIDGTGERLRLLEVEETKVGADEAREIAVWIPRERTR